ncbi:MAG: NifB/NifX family molybdenum-iron cluster-binding protein [Ignavibacteria bacterium]|nr:NifB/NifX family molybdenum-iron cluster-binding protein [Ignavibacteria bacterium]MDP3832311.1 NifB/NifX family molybdenum-iron cluster-binding protein [Ignavibacteriaceae bacterium]
MLILIGSDGETIDSKIAKRFGHANYYLVYDTNSNSLEVFKNDSEEHDHKNLEQFLIKGVEAFIVGNIGPHAFEIINTSKSFVYLVRKCSVKEAIDKLKLGELTKLTEPTVKKNIEHDHNEEGHHHHNH